MEKRPDDRRRRARAARTHFGGARTAALAVRCVARATAGGGGGGGGGERMAEVGRLLHPDDRDRLLAALPPAYPKGAAHQHALHGAPPPPPPLTRARAGPRV